MGWGGAFREIGPLGGRKEGRGLTRPVPFCSIRLSGGYLPSTQQNQPLKGLMSPVDIPIQYSPEGGAHEAVDDEIDGGVEGEEKVGDGGSNERPQLGDPGAAVSETLPH